MDFLTHFPLFAIYFQYNAIRYSFTAQIKLFFPRTYNRTQVRGNIINQTLLPMPIIIDKVMQIQTEIALG